MLGAHVFDAAHGGAILWQHLFWFFGHPEVYIIALPFFGIVTEILPVFSRKPIFGYVGLVGATLGIAILSVAVWAHHMFVTGAVDLPFFSGMTFLIAVPTGVKFFNWIGTMWGGSLSFDTPMLWSVGFLTTFLFGGLTGVILASPPLDFHVSDSYFVVAHFHYVVFGTVVFAMFAGFYFWWPKMTGRMLDERLGKVHFWLLFVGFHTTFLVQHWLGVEGMPRRYADYLPEDGFTTLNQVSTIGAFLLGASTLPFLYNVWISRRAPAGRGRRPVGLGPLAGVGHLLPAAAPQLRDDPADPLGVARPSTCTTRRSRRSSSSRTRPPVTATSPTPPTWRAASSRSSARPTPRRRTPDEVRSLDLRDLHRLLRAGQPRVLVHHRRLDRHLRAHDDDAAVGHGDALPRLPRRQDGPASGGPQGRRDRRRRRRAGLLPAVLLVAAVVRRHARRSASSGSRSAPGGCSSSEAPSAPWP